MKKIIIYTIAIICPFFIEAQTTWSLKECINHAINNNLSIQRTQVDVNQSEINVNTSKWSRLPNLGASAGQNFSWGRSASPVDNTYTNINSASSSFSLSTNVPLFTGGQLHNQYLASQLDLKAAVEDLNKAKEDMSVNVTSLYIKVLYNLEISNVAKEQHALSTEQLKRVERLLELGKTSPDKVSEAKARIAQDEMSVVQADNNYKLSLLDLSQALELSTPDGFNIVIPNSDISFLPLTAPNELYEQALDIKPSIKAAQYRLDVSEKNIRIAQSAYLPQLSLGAGLGSNFYSTNGRASSSFFNQLDKNLNEYVGINLSIPIFNRFSTRNRVNSAKLQQTALSIRLDETKKALYKEIQQSWYNALAAETKYNASITAVKANEEAFNLISKKLENDKATSIEFNEAKLNLMKSVSDQIQAKYDYIFCAKILDFYKGIPIEL